MYKKQKGSKTIDIGGIGPVLFERSRRAKRLNITVKPFRGVRVAVPYRVSLKEAGEFARAKSPWIEKHLDRVKSYEREHEARSRNAHPVDRAEAKRKISWRLNYLADRHGFTYNRVFIRNQRTRWGSCSHRNNISLNMKLVLLPDELMDYVILHELAHTRCKNHSSEFWAGLDRLVGNGKRMDARLKACGLGML